MACPCCGAGTRAVVGTFAIDTGVLVGTPTTPVTVIDKEKIDLIFAAGVPAGGDALPVNVVINGANVPVYDKYGNVLLGVAIKQRRNLHAYFGTNGAEGAHLQLTKYPWCEC